ncbi:Propionyl-CoA carboxylase alpha chain [Diplonema papillatum]|nr:Propionyl-CoA carboxylase alpha chain [Diplonema papillatum]
MSLRRVALRCQRRGKVELVKDTHYFNKVLIANRGEIACRVMKTCKKLGIRTVAVYSTPDEHSKHVKMADEAVHVGAAASRDSYLRMDRILQACKDTGADAVHPGYGFLSENAEFARELEQLNIEFIGPSHQAIDAMGDKIHSKKLAAQANVSCIPGVEGEIHTKEEMYEAAEVVGYPIMIKASAGGGGKGMRIAWNKKQASQEWDAAKREAISSFGDDRMLVEKYIDNPRHIEVQVLGDKLGTIVALPERECSIQRRNQKVIEEAPSMFIDPETRKAMGAQAVALARAVNYHTAGTVEMLVDSQKNFYFLEMNTRLQVEHPITEEITKLDLVEEMLRAARGLPLSVTQDDIKIHGWATECRVYAEDPTRNYAPSIGMLSRYIEPTGEGVRVDSGISEGSEISMYYDPMICKLITHADTREECMSRMNTALDQYVVRGVNHNIALLRDVLMSKVYQSGDISTKYLANEYPEGFAGHVLEPSEALSVRAVAAIMKHKFENSKETRKKKTSSEFRTTLEGETAVTIVSEKAADHFSVVIDGAQVECEEVEWLVGKPVFSANLTIDGKTLGKEYLQCLNFNDELTWTVQYMGTPYPVSVLSPLQFELKPIMPPPKVQDTSKLLLAPMPGAVVKVCASVGQKIVVGEELVILEAMKMQQSLISPVDAVVKKVNVQAGDAVEDEQILIEFE